MGKKTKQIKDDSTDMAVKNSSTKDIKQRKNESNKNESVKPIISNKSNELLKSNNILHDKENTAHKELSNKSIANNKIKDLLKSNKENDVKVKSSRSLLWMFLFGLFIIPAAILFCTFYQPSLIEDIEKQFHSTLDTINLKDYYSNFVNAFNEAETKFESDASLKQSDEEKLKEDINAFEKAVNSVDEKPLNSDKINEFDKQEQLMEDIQTLDNSINFIDTTNDLDKTNIYSDKNSKLDEEISSKENNIESHTDLNHEELLKTNSQMENLNENNLDTKSQNYVALNSIKSSTLNDMEEAAKRSLIGDETSSDYEPLNSDKNDQLNLQEIEKSIDSNKISFENPDTFELDKNKDQDILTEKDSIKLSEEALNADNTNLQNEVYKEENLTLSKDNRLLDDVEEKDILLDNDHSIINNFKHEKNNIDDYSEKIENIDKEAEIKERNFKLEKNFDHDVHVLDLNIADLGITDEILDAKINAINQYSEEKGREAVHDYHDQLLRNPEDIFALFGKARSLTFVAEAEYNHVLLTESVEHYLKILSLNPPEKKMFFIAAKYCLLSLTENGQENLIENILETLYEKFPNDIDLIINVGIDLLNYNKINESKILLEWIITAEPTSINAQLVLGYLHATYLYDYKKAVELMLPIISHANTNSLELFDALSKALILLNEKKMALQIYERAVELDLIPSLYQRPRQWMRHIKSYPWWTEEDSVHIPKQLIDTIAEKWQQVLGDVEYLTSDKSFTNSIESFKDYVFYTEDQFTEKCQLFESTCKMLEFEFTKCSNCQASVRLVKAGSNFLPSCASSNDHLLFEMALLVDPLDTMRVTNVAKLYTPGTWLLYDPSFQHELKLNNENTFHRIFLQVQIMHPDTVFNNS